MYAGECGPEDASWMVPSGIACVDELSGGWRRGHLHLICGLTGTGKTAMLVQTAVAAARAGYRVYFVSCEVPGKDLVPRLLGDYLDGVACPDGGPATVTRLVRRGAGAREVLASVGERAREDLSRIIVDSRGWVGLQEALGSFVAYHLTGGVDLLVVDYLQLLRSSNGSKHDRREREVAEAAESLKRAAVQYSIAVVAGAQLVDPPAWIAEHRRSHGSAVRESRAAAHAADMVLEIHPDPDDDGNGRYRPCIVRFAKCRHFPSGMTYRCVFDTFLCRFVPHEDGGQARAAGGTRRTGNG